MKSFVCIQDRVFFNKRIYNYGDCVTITEELAEKISPARFQPKEEWDAERAVIVKKVSTAEKEGKTIKEVITEAEEEKKKIKAECAAKIEKLEKQLNPKVKNDI